MLMILWLPKIKNSVVVQYGILLVHGPNKIVGPICNISNRLVLIFDSMVKMTQSE